MERPNRLLFSHPTGNANVRAAVVALYEAGLLQEFHTTVATFPGNLWDVFGKVRWGAEFQRRKYDACLRPFTVQHPYLELGRLLSRRLNLSLFNRHESGLLCIDAVYEALCVVTAKCLRKGPKTFTGVYAYEDGALETFRAARDLGLRRFYELPIAYWETAQQLLQEEARLRPAWEQTLGGTRDSPGKLRRKAEEMELAEAVICPSQFVANSLPERARRSKKVIIAPFGSPRSSPPKEFTPSIGRKLRVLFAGSMSQRKGLGDLMTAMRRLKRPDVELVIMGAPQAPMEFYRNEFNDFIYEPTRPHALVLELMRSCDLFCLPSIIEGRALVMQEAMSQGLPLIITANTGGEDLIEEGVTGFLVPIRQPDEIARKIAWFADNRAALREMSLAAQKKATQMTWERYGQTIIKAILDLNQS